MEDTSVGAGSARRGRAVVVGDDPAELRRLTAYLEPADQRVVTAQSGSEVLRAIEGIEAAVVVIDTHGGAGEALGLVRTIRADERAPGTPVLLVVEGGDGHDPALDEALELGAVDVLVAPIGAKALRAKVRLLAELSVKNRQLVLLTEKLRRAGERAEQRQQVLAAQQKVMRALASGTGDDLMHRVARTIARGLGWQVGTYWVPVGQEVRCAESWFAPSFSAPALARLYAESPPGRPSAVVHRAAETRLPEWEPLTQLDDSDPYVRAAREVGLSAALALPIAAGPELLGVIELLRTSSRPPGAQTMATLDAMATLIAHFAKARETVEKTETLQNEFFALVSHELLTPLTSILGYLEELLAGASGELNPDQQQDLEVVDRNAHRLFRLVDDLMFVAQVESGKLSLNLTSVDLVALTREAVAAAQPTAKGRDVRIKERLESVGFVHGDPMRLGQLVDHLLSNAVKFSHDGGRVDVVLRRVDGSAFLDVIDEGLGIPADEQTRVFERFSRSTIASAREIPGIGLGLSISKVIVEAHGGSISVKSTEGVGSTFTVTLPLERPASDRNDHGQE